MSSGSPLKSPPDHLGLRELYLELAGRAEAQIRVDLRVSVLTGAGYSRGQVAEKLGVEQAEVRASIDRLRAVHDPRVT